jgi:hypothetical protein
MWGKGNEEKIAALLRYKSIGRDSLHEGAFVQHFHSR